jgi:hypothetical protein
MGEEEREKKFAPARVAAQQIAQCKYGSAKNVVVMTTAILKYHLNKKFFEAEILL